jgi:hypothetical protein
MPRRAIIHAPQESPSSASQTDAVFARVLGTLRRYRKVIYFLMGSAAALWAVILLVVILFGPTRKTSWVSFRLVFEGAKAGRYPNGTKFSANEIVALPVLAEVHRSNNLEQFMSLGQFSRALFVAERNDELQRLMAEFDAKLSDIRLSSVDRERLEREYASRRAAIDNSDYALHFVRKPGAKAIPPTVVDKVLRDVLATWARQAESNKRVLDYPVKMLTESSADTRIDPTEPAVSLLMARRRADVLLLNLDALENVPGAPMVRVGNPQKTLADIRLDLQDLIRFRLDPRILSLGQSGAVRDRRAVMSILEAQLAYDRAALQAGQSREAAVRSVLESYDGSTPESTVLPSGQREALSGQQQDVTPILAESFVERMMELTNRDKDRFRQTLAQDMRQQIMSRIPAEGQVQFDQAAIQAMSTASAAYDPRAASALAEELRRDVAALRSLTATSLQIYEAASRQMSAATELVNATGPVVTRTERGVSTLRVMLYGLLFLMLALPAIIAACLLHEHFWAASRRREAIDDDEDRDEVLPVSTPDPVPHN